MAQAQPRRIPAIRVPSLFLLCFSLFAFGTFTKVVQYYPQLDLQLRISNSSKIEKHQFDARTFEMVAAAESSVASHVPIIPEEPESRLVSLTPEPPLPESIDPLITSRPPPFQI